MERRGDGWVVFAGIVLITAGIMRVFDAIWAFRYHGALPSNLEDAIFGHSLKTYGWVYLVVAAILIASGFMVFGGSRDRPVGRGRCRRGRSDQRDLVDAVLPGMVVDLHRHRRNGGLRAYRVRRQSPSRPRHAVADDATRACWDQAPTTQQIGP